MTEGRTPLFSVVVPVYNRSQSVLPTLMSVKEQTCADFECLVVDDGSDDGAELNRVVESLEDPRFHYLRRENGGGGAARNTGVSRSKGTYISFLDSDDLFLPNKLAVMAHALDPDPRVVLYSQALVDRGVGAFWCRPSRPIGATEDMGEFMFVQNQFIQTSTIVMQRRAALAVPFDPMLRKGQDLDLCLRLHAAGHEFRMVSPPLTIWRDVSEDQRASRGRGFDGELQWLTRSRPLLSDRAFRGYRATVLAYHMARAHPLTATRYLLDGLVRGGVPLATTARQFLRSFLARGAYRRLVDQWVTRRGTTLSAACKGRAADTMHQMCSTSPGTTNNT